MLLDDTRALSVNLDNAIVEMSRKGGVMVVRYRACSNRVVKLGR